MNTRKARPFQIALLMFVTLISGFCHSNTGIAAPAGGRLKAILPLAIEPKMVPANKGKPAVKAKLTKEQEKANADAAVEKQALDDIAKGDLAGGIRRYNVLARNYQGTRQGGAIDLRVLDLYRRSTKPGDSPVAFQKALLSAQEKYKDENVLGASNKAMVPRISQAIHAMHRTLVAGQIQAAKVKSASPTQRRQALIAVETYLDKAATDAEKERLRAEKGEIQYLSENHIAAAATFAALASEAKGTINQAYWRLAIRSQILLAAWKVDPPWDGISNGSAPARETLKGMYQSLARPTDWEIVAHIGLLETKLSQETEAFKLFTDLLTTNVTGPHPPRAAGLMAATYLQNKSWQSLETLARLLLKQNLKGVHLKQTFDGRTLLGTSLLEGGLEKYAAADHKASVTKLDEFVRGWKAHPRHDEAFYFLAMAHQGAKNYKTATETLVNFTKSYPKSKYRHDALVNGGAWSLALGWEDHVMYFLEAHVKEFGRDQQVLSSMETLVNLYLGREHYDSASRIMELQLVNPQISAEAKSDIARRLLDMHEKHGSSESALRIADLLLKGFKQASIMAPALSLKARLQAAQSGPKLEAILRQLSGLDISDRNVVEALAEVNFLRSESMAKGAFDREVYSLESKNPLGDLNQYYGKYEQVRAAYESVCTHSGSSWCGPAMHRLARVSEQFTDSVAPLEIPRSIEPSEVKTFLARKKSIIDTVNERALNADERSVQEASAGSTNPDWTGAILWQNASDWQSERVSGETGNGYIQWHAGAAN